MSSNNLIKQNIKSTLFLTFITSVIWVVLTGALMTAFGFANPAQTNQSEGLTSMLALFGLCISNSIMVVWYTNRTIHTGAKIFCLL